MVDLLTVQEASLRIISAFQPLSPVEVSFDDGLGRVLASDIISDLNFPRFPNSSMDGYAVRSEDTQKANPDHPLNLKVVGDIPAGSHPTHALQAGQAMRVMTGAMVPDQADAVVPFENVTDSGETEPYPQQITIVQAAKPGQFIRPVGQDIHAGQVVMKAGQLLRPQEIGLLAMIGKSTVPVYRKPRIAVISTGEELIPLDQTLSPGKIYDSNAPMLTALFRQAGAEVVFLSFAHDNLESVRQILDAAVEQDVDLLVTSGGVSIGAYDFVRLVVEMDGDIDFWRVNIRPGKPLAFGHYRGRPMIGLPGNPVSAFVGFKVFVEPAVAHLAGRSEQYPKKIRARLAEAIESDGRESYLRAKISSDDNQVTARLTGHQGSGNLLSLVDANALLIIPSGVKSLPAGSEVDVWPLDIISFA